MKKIRVVQYGTWGFTHSEHIMSTMQNFPELFDIVGVCEPDKERRTRAMMISCYNGLPWLTVEEVLNNKTVDAIIIETDELSQDSAALKFVEAGFHIHLEKPGGASNDFEKAVKAAQRNKKVFHVGYMYRYNPAIKEAVSLAKSGILGKINYVEAQMSARYTQYGLKELERLPSGMMFYLGCHLVDLVYKIMGYPKKIIPYHFSTGSENIACTDCGFVLYEYDRGISFIKTSASEVNGDARRQLIISGSNGTVEICPLENPLEIPQFVCPQDVKCKITYKNHINNVRNFDFRSEIVSFPPFGRYDDMMKDFVRKVNGEEETEFIYEHELAVHEMLLNSI